ncbi:sec-independent protein translocase protein TatC [Paenibacillus cellulosilyticus]|uniref:Sec-independent protein translocase protein TatC n=1 Tax=Paenibacillus cellulosilyticus TaxID=375489 RepID=A0A2V2YMR9_9BACL|nr:twin-arginine translocase subunit TatC [Paenibacillus cellulosilyticus]PWV95543.1 sec-independent protein translocase protein TatC [Paenibacillus cellulosilyticus]QKS47376.1 twin-arginine translocase subunit TatC [Paenibacillus cellulosilyticus]
MAEQRQSSGQSAAEMRSRIREDGLMPLLEHLGELRRRLFWTILVLVVGLCIGLYYAKPLYNFVITDGPMNGVDLHTFSLWDGIGMYMKFAFLISLVLVLPFGFYQLWAFVKPALSPKEQKATLKYIPFALMMFLIGLAFAYFVIAPMAFEFTTSVSRSLGLIETYGVMQYIQFLFNILIPISLLFELPLVIMFLTKLRILNPIRLRRMRRVAYFVMVLIGTIITPPDVISDVTVAIPLLILYEISIFLSSSVYKRQQAADAAWERDFDAGSAVNES